MPGIEQTTDAQQRGFGLFPLAMHRRDGQPVLASMAGLFGDPGEQQRAAVEGMGWRLTANGRFWMMRSPGKHKRHPRSYRREWLGKGGVES